jgi:putative phosphoribosyl transferase
MQSLNRYADRTQAGQALAEILRPFTHRDDTLVLALPRGGVPVAAEIARTLHLPLDLFLVRKLGTPDDPEFALGALTEGGVQVTDRKAVDEHQLTPAQLDVAVARAEGELAAQQARYGPLRGALPINGRRIILVDDGAATGWTLRAALAALRVRHPAQLTVAIPVGSPGACERLEEFADQVICPQRPEPFHAVGLWYVHFSPVSDDEVCAALEEARGLGASGPPRNDFR